MKMKGIVSAPIVGSYLGSIGVSSSWLVFTRRLLWLLLEKGVVCPINVVIDEPNKSQVSFSLGLGIEKVCLLPS
jgi:hypothetical protein